MRLTNAEHETIFEVLYATYAYRDFNGLYGVIYHFKFGHSSSVRSGNFVYMESQMNLALLGQINYKVHGTLPEPIPKGKL